MLDYCTALASARDKLTEVENPALEAEVLLAHVLGKPRSHLLAWPERALDAVQQQAYSELIQRRCGGEPLAYITGEREFWSLSLQVGPGVLIPRPDTELLVELALDLLPADSHAQVADLGTGSGAIAAAIGRERPHWQLVAVEHCPQARAIALANFQRLGLTHVSCRAGDWCAGFEPLERFDLILSNPPYIADNDPHLQLGDLPAEPRQALASGADGLDDLRHICHCAPAYLKPGGWLLLEHGYDQGKAVRQLLKACNLERLRTERDFSGHERVSLGQLAEIE